METTQTLTGTFREVVEFVDRDRVTRFGVVRKTYWLSDGEIRDSEWLDTFDTRREAESVMLAGTVEDAGQVMTRHKAARAALKQVEAGA